MACYRPIPAFQSGPGAVPRLWPPLGSENMVLPCGKCLGCRTDRATEWAARSEHEASRWQHNIFLTLTYDDEHEPRGGHLAPEDLTRFLKRLRIHRERNPVLHRCTAPKLRYLACGEYGDRHGRPHYHAILYDCDFADRVTRTAELSGSDTLDKLWGKGFALYGDANGGAAGYVAAYALKRSNKHWSERDGYADEHGEWHEKPQPFLRVSTKPPIGATWLERYADDLQHGYTVKKNGRLSKVPRSYIRRLEKQGNQTADAIKFEAWKASVKRHEQITPERLKAMEEIHQRRKQLLDNKKL